MLSFLKLQVNLLQLFSTTPECYNVNCPFKLSTYLLWALCLKSVPPGGNPWLHLLQKKDESGDRVYAKTTAIYTATTCNASNQEYYWLKMEIKSTSTCSTNFRAFLCRTPQKKTTWNRQILGFDDNVRVQQSFNHSFTIWTVRPFVHLHLQDGWLVTVLYNAKKTK